MEFEQVVFPDAGPSCPVGIKLPKMHKSQEFTVMIPVARNSKKIEKGEVLVLPFMMD